MQTYNLFFKFNNNLGYLSASPNVAHNLNIFICYMSFYCMDCVYVCNLFDRFTNYGYLDYCSFFSFGYYQNAPVNIHGKI